MCILIHTYVDTSTQGHRCTYVLISKCTSNITHAYKNVYTHTYIRRHIHTSTHMYIRTYKQMHFKHIAWIQGHICTYVLISTWACHSDFVWHACTYTYTYTHIHTIKISPHTYQNILTHIYIFRHMHRCAQIYLRTNTHIHWACHGNPAKETFTCSHACKKNIYI